MPNRKLTDTWIIDDDATLGPGTELVKAEEDVFVSLATKNGGWERVGPMKTYWPVVVGRPLSLLSPSGEGVNATKVIEASGAGDAYVVKTSEGLTVRIETYGSAERQTPKATRVGEIIGYVRSRFGL